ncbi:MAG: AAA family ATPase [Ktedonobacteraceae bacterium]
MAWALCIASGTSWLGHAVLQGPVAYIAGEGSFGIGPRLKAWKTHHRFQGDSGVCWFDEALILQDASNLSEVHTAFAEDFPEPPVLVVIDTLSRCSGGADENSNTDMAKIIAAADSIQQRFHCTVLIVHHAGKDRDRGQRGASSLIGNTETIIEVAPTDDGCRVVCYKQKDAPKFEVLFLQLQPVQYGPDEGSTSAVLIYGDTEVRPRMKPSESVMYAVLAGKELTHTEWKKAGMEAKLGDRTARDAISALVRTGRVQKTGKLYSTSPSEEDQGPPEGE